MNDDAIVGFCLVVGLVLIAVSLGIMFSSVAVGLLVIGGGLFMVGVLGILGS